MMNIVPVVERTWKKRADELVGGPRPYVPPDEYETELVSADPERVFEITGPAYTDALFSTYTPILANTGHLALQFEYQIDQNTLDDAQALEMDSRMVKSKLGNNWSSQINVQKGWIWQVYIKGQGWVDTTFRVGQLASDVWHQFRFEYSFNLVAHTFSFESLQIDNFPLFHCPQQFKNLPSTPLVWADGVALQIQLNLNAKGGAYQTKLRRGLYIWS